MTGIKNRFTFKIIFSYGLLVILALIASYYVYVEIEDYISTETSSENDEKLLKTSSFLTQLYEAESLSRLAIQSKTKKNFNTYAQKIDSIFIDIEALKTLTDNDQQRILLDSLHVLLEKKVANNEVLRKLKTQNQTSVAITSALAEFDKMEASLGIITPEGLAPNLDELSPKAQEAIRKVADYLNANIPKTDSEEQKARKVDSVLQQSKALLKEVQTENTVNENSLAQREITINKADLELSQQLRAIVSSFEQEMMLNSFNDNIKKEAALKRSIRLAVIAALLGFLVVGIFTFILNRDFWKANLLRQKLEKEKKYSESLLKSREQLIATVSHDLRTPLSTISGYTELIEESGITTKQKDYVSSIKSASGYVTNLVNDLLDFSQLEAGKMTADKKSFNLSKLLTETARNIANNQHAKNIDLILEIDDRLEQPIINDSFRVRQIITNLIGNAYKFTTEGRITVKAELVNFLKSNNTVKISVMDTGIGISEEKQELIFHEFTQAENNKKYGGYGLGLTISKKLTELLKGKLTLESALGEGSTFTLELPVVFDKQCKTEMVIEEPQAVLNNIKILVFDDDDSFRQLITEMLKSSVMKSIAFDSFNAIENGYLDINYDLVLTDIEMPTVSGFDVLNQLKSGKYPHYANQPIIAMTGRRDLERELFISHGFSQVLQKPFSKTVLVSTIKSLLENKEVSEKEKNNYSAHLKNGLFSLETLESFLGDDTDAINSVLQTFLLETGQNTKILKKSVTRKDYDAVNKTAHKMLPMFRQLQVSESIQILEAMETANAKTLSFEKLKSEFILLEKLIVELESALENEVTKHPNHSG